MRHFYPQMSAQRQQQIVDETRAAGRMGAVSIPVAVTMDESVSDTCIRKLPGALAIGHQQRAANDEYNLWLAANAIRLSEQVSDSGAADGGAWLRQQYTIETGKVP